MKRRFIQKWGCSPRTSKRASVLPLLQVMLNPQRHQAVMNGKAIMGGRTRVHSRNRLYVKLQEVRAGIADVHLGLSGGEFDNGRFLVFRLKSERNQIRVRQGRDEELAFFHVPHEAYKDVEDFLSTWRRCTPFCLRIWPSPASFSHR